MSDSSEKKFDPISASADGKRNSYSRRCDVLGQVMNYAACLWRLSVLGKADVRTPADWAPCSEASRCGRCHAVQMRQEEELKGHAIYFVDRGVRASLAIEARAWISPSYSKKPPSAASPAPKPPVSGKTMLEVMGEGSGYADAINAAAAGAAPVPAPAPRPTLQAPLPKIDMLPGESPLAYARRLRAAQQPTA